MSSFGGFPSRVPHHRDPTALIPIAAGLTWLLAGHGIGWWLWAALPGCLLLGGGVSVLLWPGEIKQTQYLALGAILGLLFGWPAWIESAAAVPAMLLSAASFVVAGRVGLRVDPPGEEVPEPPAELQVYAKAALDEALMGYFVTVAKVPDADAVERLIEEAGALETALRGSGAGDPATFHRAPPPPDDPRLVAAQAAGYDYERLRFTSGYATPAGLPGAARWSGHLRNRDCAAWVHRHEEQGRPWLLCIHGYRMGWPWIDFRLFSPGHLHGKFGLNLLMPVLPLHGPRRAGLNSGDLYLDGDLLNLFHAQGQALWDLRRHIAWIRAQEPHARIGVLGYSLGGYNASLLVAHEPGLDFVVAGIPVADFVPILWQQVPAGHRRYLARRGFDQERYASLLRVVSPLAREPQLSRERLHIFAGSADRVVPPDQPLRLQHHWQREVAWYAGGHLSFRGEPAVDRCIEGAMIGAGWQLRPAL